MYTNWIKIILINIAVFIVTLLVLELGWRGFLLIESCFSDNGCNFHYISKIELVNPEETKIGFTRPDKDLGYVPKEGFKGRIKHPIWHNSLVEIDDEGFRSSELVTPKKSGRIICSGDSFTFGDQVNNSETWPACIQRQLSIKVDNAGVSGYGVIQSVLRIKQASKLHSYRLSILSILVGNDILRDQLIYRSGFPKPFLTKHNGVVSYNSPPQPPYAVGSKYNRAWMNSATLELIFKNSILGNYAIKKLNLNEANLNKLAQEPANKIEILQWVLKEYRSLPIPKKIILLQYNSHGINSLAAVHERELIKREAEKFGIDVIDTYNVLTTSAPEDVWDEHHTAFGNELVCKTILPSISK